jgi:hypothetical protein
VQGGQRRRDHATTTEQQVSDDFWDVIDAQLGELRTATTADEVLRILSLERNPYGPGVTSADGFFAGPGGEVVAVLTCAGWEPVSLFQPGGVVRGCCGVASMR